MTTKLNAYVSFRDTAREALEFYRSVLGGEVTVHTFGDSGMPHQPDEADRVMHGVLTTPDGLEFFAADTPTGMEHAPGGAISMALFGDDHAKLSGYWDGLTAGGTVQMPLSPAPWGDTFGMCTDRFGVAWMINVTGSVSDGA